MERVEARPSSMKPLKKGEAAGVDRVDDGDTRHRNFELHSRRTSMNEEIIIRASISSCRFTDIDHFTSMKSYYQIMHTPPHSTFQIQVWKNGNTLKAHPASEVLSACS